jgi:hypothetical protein
MRTMAMSAVIVAGLLVPLSLGDIVIPGIDPGVLGTDGELTLSGGNVTYDLSTAPTGSWTDAGGDVTGDGIADGVYDPEKWAVVFKYSSVNINLGHSSYRLSFNNHPSRAPVVWLVSGDVTISGGGINLRGQNDLGDDGFARGGPGGFRGARGELGSVPGSGGFGPGGGEYLRGIGNGGGAHAVEGNVFGAANPAYAYGNLFCLPLIGGSGAGARYNADNYGGGGGGGAILIIAQGTITVNGAGIDADGGDGGGSGGGGGTIRMLADSITVNGALRARGGSSGHSSYGVSGTEGRIFVQANSWTLNDVGIPEAVTTDFNSSPFLVWPPDENHPTLDPAPTLRADKIVLQDTSEFLIPTDPRASLDYPQTDVAFDTQDPVNLHVAAEYVPLDWIVMVRIIDKAGDTQRVQAFYDSGTLESSTWIATMTLPRGFGAIQVLGFEDPSKR